MMLQVQGFLNTMLCFSEFTQTVLENIHEEKYRNIYKSPRSGHFSPYWTGLKRRRKRIGGMTYTVTYRNGKAKLTKRMRTVVGKKRASK
jgi:hypothetical protein